MPSITPTISEMRDDDWLMRPIVSITRVVTSPPRRATADASLATWAARRAASALPPTLAAISEIACAVSIRSLACCSVRLDRCMLPPAISDDALPIEWTPSRTWMTRSRSPVCMSLSAAVSRPTSSWLLAGRCCVRSPWATARALRAAAASGTAMRADTTKATIKPRTFATSSTPRTEAWVATNVDSACLTWASATRPSWAASSSRSAARPSNCLR